MSLNRVFIWYSGTDGRLTQVPATGLLFGVGQNGTVLLGDQSNSITGIYNSILGGNLNSIEGNSSRGVIGGGSLNRILAGSSNFITAGNSNWISGAGNSVNTIVGGCSNTILGNQSIIGGGCGNFLGGGTGDNLYRCASTNSILGGQYNCAFAANPRDLSSVFTTLNGWNGISFSNPSCYNPPTESAIVAGLQNRIGGCASFIGAGTDNWSISDRSIIIGGKENKNRSYFGSIGGGDCNAIAQGGFNLIANGFCNRIGLEFAETIFNAPIWKCASYSYIGNGAQNKIIDSSYSSIIGGRNNRICSSPDAVLVGGRDNCLAGCSAFIGGGENNCAFAYHTTIGGGHSNKALGNCSTVLGGRLNRACAGYSAILAGYNTLIENTHEGAVVIADAQDREHTSRGEHTITLDFAKGIFFTPREGNISLNITGMIV